MHQKARKFATAWPNEMLSHQSTGHLDAITESFNSDSSALTDRSFEYRERTMANNGRCSTLQCLSDLWCLTGLQHHTGLQHNTGLWCGPCLCNERTSLCCGNGRFGRPSRIGRPSGQLRKTGSRLSGRSNSLLRGCPGNTQHAVQLKWCLSSTTPRLL